MEDWREILRARETTPGNRRSLLEEGIDVFKWQLWGTIPSDGNIKGESMNGLQSLRIIKEAWGKGDLFEIAETFKREITIHNNNPRNQMLYYAPKKETLTYLKYGYGMRSFTEERQDQLTATATICLDRLHSNFDHVRYRETHDFTLVVESTGPDYFKRYFLARYRGADGSPRRIKEYGEREEDLELTSENFRYILALDCRNREESGILEIE